MLWFGNKLAVCHLWMSIPCWMLDVRIYIEYQVKRTPQAATAESAVAVNLLTPSVFDSSN